MQEIIQLNMKRIVAIFSLIIIMVAGLQPMIAMHYCGDELHSLKIYQSVESTKSCCGNSDSGTTLNLNGSCCETEILKLATDDYQNKAEQFVSQLSTLILDGTGFILADWLNSSQPDAKPILPSLKFPTTGLHLNDVSIHTYICIYRI